MKKIRLVKSISKKIIFVFIIALFAIIAFMHKIPSYAKNEIEEKNKTTLEINKELQASTAEVAGMFEQTLTIVLTNVSKAVTPTPQLFAGLCSGSISWVANKAIKELTSLIISSDIDGLSDVLIALQDPTTRAELQHKALVKQIAKSVEEIKESVAKIEKQIADLSDKMDKYATAQAYNTAAQRLQDLIADYQIAWNNYQAVISRGNALAELEEKYPLNTRTSLQQSLIDAAQKDVNIAVATFLNTIEEGGGLSFIADIQKLPGYLWNPNVPTQSYLGAYEAYLRERYTFEHQITTELFEAVNLCININTQMLTLYSEYYSYKKQVAEQSGDMTTYADYTDNYFTNIQYCVVKNLNAMVESTNYGSYALPNPLTTEEIASAKEINANFKIPETIDTTIYIGGKKYNAYKVRDNSTLNYYIIVQNSFSNQDIIKKYQITEIITGTRKIYKPDFILDNKFTDDGRYQMISSKDELTFIGNSWTNLRASLRDNNGCNLSKIPSTIERVLLYGYTIDDATEWYASWNINFLDVNLNNSSNKQNTEKIYDNTTSNIMLIYRDISNDTTFDKNGIYKLNDADLLNNRVFYITDNQTLDFSEVERNVKNITIMINGSATIISNPNITFNNSRIEICETNKNDKIKFENLKIEAGGNDKAALSIKSECTIEMIGDLLFVGSREITNLYLDYSSIHPIYASHGILVSSSCTINGGGTVNACGNNGGSGICVRFNHLTISNLNVTATGSVKHDGYLTLGAGIGSSVSFKTKYENTYSAYPTIISPSSSLVYGNNTAKLTIENSKINVTGAELYPDKIAYSDDIGGVHYKANNSNSEKAFDLDTGTITNTTLTLNTAKLSTELDYKDSKNKFIPDIYKITAYTNGYNGTVSNGISLKFVGTDSESEWVYTDIGEIEGEYSCELKASSVGDLKAIKVKSNKSTEHTYKDAWFGGKITVETLYSKKSITVYGGRWITDETVLKPTDNIYELTINTGNEKNAGTDAEISAYLQDNNGNKTENYHLSYIGNIYKPFQKGSTNTFVLYAPNNFEECTNIIISSDNSGYEAGWLLSNLKINKIQGNSNDEGFVFNANQWFEEEKPLNFGKYSGSTGIFDLEIKTSDVKRAGTDSDIYLIICGDKGQTEEIELDLYVDGNNFERNDKDCFTIGSSSINIGNINEIKIRKNNAGVGPDWHLDYITIIEKTADGQQARSVTFKINDWIEDKQYSFDSKYIKTNNLKSSMSINRELLKQLKQESENHYSLNVSQNIVMTTEAFDLISEKGIIFTLNMMQEDGELLYSVTFNGEEFRSQRNIAFKSGYSFANGYAIIDFLSDTELPRGTVLKINTKVLGFKNNNYICVLQKDQEGNWNNDIDVISEDDMIEVSIEEGKKLLIKGYYIEIPTNMETDVELPDIIIWLGIVIIIFILIFPLVIIYLNKKIKIKEK